MITNVQLTPLVLLALGSQTETVFRATLEAEQYRLIQCEEKEAILQLCDQRSPDAVILEHALPDLDAVDVCRAIRQAFGDQMAVLIILPQHGSTTVEDALAAGADDVMFLPLHPALVRKRLSLFAAPHTIPPQRYRDLFNSTNDAIIISDAQSQQILEINTALSHLVDYQREELLKMSMAQIVPNAQPYFLEQITLNGSMIYEENYRRRDGMTLPVEVSANLINYEGKPAFLSVVRDISQRRKTQEAERQQWVLAKALRESAAAINGTLELEQVLARVLASVQMVVKCEAASIMTIRDGIARFTGWYGYNKLDISEKDWLAAEHVVSERATMRWIVEHKQSLCIPDTRKYSGWFVPEKDDWVRSYVGAPIIIEDEVVGFLNLDSGIPGNFTERDAQNLQAFADQAAIAIQNARLYKAAQLHADELEKRVEQRTEQLLHANAILEEQISERLIAEEALAQERNLLRTLIDTLLDEVYVKDLEGRLVLVNAPLRRRLQHLMEDRDLIGATIYDLTTKPKAEVIDNETRRILQTGEQIVNQEVSVRDWDGNIRWKLTTRTPLRDSKGQIIGLIGINHDVTELRGTEERLMHVIMGANCLLWYSTVEYRNGEFIWNGHVSNETAAQHFLPIEIPAGMSYMEAWYHSVVAEDRPKCDERARWALENHFSGYNQEFRCRRKDGTVRWLYEEVRIREISKTRWSLVGVCTDMTERKQAAEALQRAHDQLEIRVVERTSELMRANAVLQEQITERLRAEQALRESEARFRALVEHAPEAIVVFDAENEMFIDANENALRLFGVTRQQILTRGPMDFSPPEQDDGTLSLNAMRVKIEAAVRGETPVFEWMYRNMRGQNIPCEVRLLLLPTSGAPLIRGSITDITARKQAEAALQMSEEKYRSLTNQLPLGVYRTTPEGILLHGNPTLATMLGYDSIDQIIGTSVLKFYKNIEDREAMMKTYELVHGGVAQTEMMLHRPDKQIIWVKNIGRGIIDGQGSIAYIDGTLEDISAWKQVQQAEQEQRLLANALQDAASDLTRTLDLDEVLDRILKHITRVMPAHQSAAIMLVEGKNLRIRVIRYLHHTEHGLETIPRRAYFPIEDMRELSQMYETQKPITYPDNVNGLRWIGDPQPTAWIRSYIGAPIQSEGHVIGFIMLASETQRTFNEDHAHRLLAFASQVGIAIQNARLFTAAQNHATELRYRVAERTAELERERVRLRAILDAMTEGVIYYEIGDTPVYTNRSLTSLTGYDEMEWMEQDRLMTVTQKSAEDFEKWQRTITDTLNRLGISKGQMKLYHKNGDEFDASLISTRVIDSEGRMVGVVTVIRDISQEKVLEAQRRRFIAHASHELRTPIANLKTRLYLIRRQPDKQDEHLQIMETVTDRMRKLVEDLLDISRFENGIIALDLVPTAIQVPIMGVIMVQEPEAEKHQQTLTFEVPDRPVYVNLDAQRFTQVITNLVVNAINYSGEGGLITVKIETEGDDVLTHVMDNGHGISPELLPNIFKPFFRGNEQNVGTGLGLSISREIIELHGGTLTVQSAPDEGACFTVRLKRVEHTGL